MVARAHSRVPRGELYGVTGIQTLSINTIFQLLADEGSPALGAAKHIALIPDLLALWLSGELANEVTIASTTGLLDARAGTWARPLVERLGLPAEPFAGDPVEAGTTLGRMLPHHGLGRLPVHAVAGHDTASAFAAAPVQTPHAAVLSSGTWSLLGLELDEPVLTSKAAAFNLTNERGVDGTIRLLRNVMGLWLVQECRRALQVDYAALRRLAEGAGGDVPLFDPDDEALLAPDDMPAEIATACTRGGQSAPDTPGRADPLDADLPRLQVPPRARTAHARHRPPHRGRARDRRRRPNELLCRLTADVAGLPVLAGPVEATALGNVLMQARATGDARVARGPARGRDRVRRSRACSSRPAGATKPTRYTGASSRSPDWPWTNRSPQLPELSTLSIETPSWGYGDSGTRFATFQQPGRPRDVFERVDDAAEVHRLTGTAPAVALHFPWDSVDDLGALRAHIEGRGLRVGAVEPQPLPGPEIQARVHHTPRRGRASARLSSTCSSASRSPPSLGSTGQSLWFADGTSYPGQDDCARDAAACSTRSARSTRRCPRKQELLVEYKPFEPAFYATDLADWGSSLSVCQRLGERARVLVDLGHHAHGTNIEQIVALLAEEGRLGGFHFNNRKYADDDLIVGSVNPFELFLIFSELVALDGLPRLTIDQAHNVEPKVEAMVLSVLNLQEAYAKALLVDRDRAS